VAAFMQALQERTTRFRQAAGAEQARRFLVRLTAGQAMFSGRLEIRSPDGSTAIRRVDGASCDDVSNALALMTALAIDPKALTGSPSGAVARRAESDAAPESGPDPQGSPPAGAVAAAGSSAVVPKAPRPWQWSAGLIGHLTSWVSPTLGYGGQLFVEAEAPESSLLGPAVRGSLFLNQSETEFPTGAAARFEWALATLEGCPVRLKVMSLHLAVHPCVSFRLGVLRGEGRRISQPKQVLSVWSDAGPVLRLRVAVRAQLMLEVQGALLLPLYRPTFAITDMGSATNAYSVPRVGGLVGIGASYRFR